MVQVDPLRHTVPLVCSGCASTWSGWGRGVEWWEVGRGVSSADRDRQHRLCFGLAGGGAPGMETGGLGTAGGLRSDWGCAR